ncbi:MAG: NADPH:quinone oxidoreductase family protein [Steroidobacteraceae bacterium]
MKAILSIAVGGPETLTLGELPIPPLGAGQVRVAVKACSVNYPDLLVIQDLYQFKPPRPFAPGSDVAGIVASVGDGVRTVRVGDRVLAACGMGGMTEQVVVAEHACIGIPETLPFDVAAALLTTYGTSQYALQQRARLARGETLLVLGAAGGVGLAAVELGKAIGARVVAGASSAAKIAVAMEHGADEGVVYPAGALDRIQAKALADQFKSACGVNGADVIYDPVGGDYTEPALRAIAWDGRLLVVGFPAGIPRIPLNLPLLKSCQIVGVFWGAAAARDPALFRSQLAELLGMYTRGAIRPLVSERFPLERAGEAIACLAGRQAIGKIVVVP